MLPLLMGIGIPLVVGMIPVRKSSNIEITKAISPWRSAGNTDFKQKDSRKLFRILLEVFLFGSALIFARIFLSKLIQSPVGPSTGQLVLLSLSFIVIFFALSDLIKMSFPRIVKGIRAIVEIFFPRAKI